MKADQRVESQAQKNRRLLVALKNLAKSNDPERAHGEAEDLLLEYINDPEITKAFATVPKWYA